mgnify:CR=1 FL=1|jgi:hypothetical protein
MRIESKVEMKGKLFERIAPRILNQIINDGVTELVQVGESYLMENLSIGGLYQGTLLPSGARKQTSTGNYRRNIRTTTKNLRGIIDDRGVVYGPWLEGVSPRNQSTPFKGYAAFRKAMQKMEDKKVAVFRAHVKKYIRKMNG